MQAALAIAALLVAGAAAFLAKDPLRMSAVVNFPDFEAHPVPLPPRSELPAARDPGDRLTAADVASFGWVQGPESVAFDPQGRGPYAGVADGRILFWNGAAWEEFAVTSPFRTEELCAVKESPLAYLKNEHKCGRPLGLRFDKKTGDLYIADPYFGLLKVGPQGGLATVLTTEAEGVPFNFTNDLDIDEEGNVYFTDSSTNYQRRNFVQLMLSSEPTGRLLKYSPQTKETSVLVRGLQFANGVSISTDGSFLVFAESVSQRLTRYWLKGEKIGTSEVFAYVPGVPDNVRTNKNGEFWVGIHTRRTLYQVLMGQHIWLRRILVRLPIPLKAHYLLSIGGNFHGMVLKYSPNGELLEVLEDSKGKTVRSVSEVEEKDGKLYIGSVLMPFLAVYDLNSDVSDA